MIELPTLTTPVPKEELYVYLATSQDAVSGVLLAEHNGKQTPIRYVNQTLHEAERNYAPQKWLYVCYIYPEDGASSLKGVDAGLVLIEPTNIDYTYAIRLNFPSTNNEAEYATLLAGLRIAQKIKVQALKVKVDSNLVACQLNFEFVASSEGMTKYLTKAKEHAALFKKFLIQNIPRNQNQKADVLSKLALVAFNHLTKEILVEVLNAKSVDAQDVNTIVKEEEDNRMTPIIKCLEEGIWPEDENEARNMRRKVSQYVMEKGALFKKSYLAPMLRCVSSL
ncbi:reverse transcriptase domain-containing protein [Tanacetum coccineum]